MHRFLSTMLLLLLLSSCSRRYVVFPQCIDAGPEAGPVILEDGGLPEPAVCVTE